MVGMITVDALAENNIAAMRLGMNGVLLPFYHNIAAMRLWLVFEYCCSNIMLPLCGFGLRWVP